MLVLSRKKNEVIVFPEGTLTVISIEGDTVKLGFVFPKQVPIHREEVWLKIQADKEKQPPADTSV